MNIKTYPIQSPETAFCAQVPIHFHSQQRLVLTAIVFKSLKADFKDLNTIAVKYIKSSFIQKYHNYLQDGHRFQSILALLMKLAHYIYTF